MSLGAFVGVQLTTNTAVIGDLPRPGERSFQLTEQYFAFPREILLEGTFTLLVGRRPMEQESFTLERVQDGKLLLTSNLQANELAATQRLQLTDDLRPLSYTLQGPLVYGGSRAEAAFSPAEGQATLSICCTLTEKGQQIQRRIVPLDGAPVLYDFSVPSHFALIYRAIAEPLARGVPPEAVRFTALTPQALRSEPLRIEEIRTAALAARGGEREVPATRYRLVIGGDANPLWVDLYALEDGESVGTLLAVHIPQQPRLASSSPITIYRSDLYPQGLENPERP